MIAQIAAALVGVWLMAAPAMLGHDGTLAADVDRVLGPIAASFGIIAAFQATRNVRRANLLVAALLVLLPIPLGHPTAALVNSVACGLLIGALSLVRGRITKANAGGWRALLDE
jgi:hypothetical protein